MTPGLQAAPEEPTIQPAAQYIGEPTFGLKQVKLELPPRYDGKPSILNTWLFEVE